MKYEIYHNCGNITWMTYIAGENIIEECIAAMENNIEGHILTNISY